jgi:N-acetylglucosaminyldiphosphoundecaprenol N-acetyl-beta-D-mannosaminyltransferase
VTGSGLFENLMAAPEHSGRKLSVFFFGGKDGVAQEACQNLNDGNHGLTCAGAQSPGFGSVEELSNQDTINRINASGADFLVVSLGARKGQAWIEHNLPRLNVPVISHLGAVVNFVAKTVDRAPSSFQKFGMEWLWRIKEEPALFARYWHDGLSLLNLMATRLLPHLVYRNLRRAMTFMQPDFAAVQLDKSASECRIKILGATPDVLPQQMRHALRDAALMETDVLVDLNDANHLSPAAFGLLLVLRKHQTNARKSLRFTGLSRHMRKQFRWNGVEYLLADCPYSPISIPVHYPIHHPAAQTAAEATSL